jgi:hypothetical protein
MILTMHAMDCCMDRAEMRIAQSCTSSADFLGVWMSFPSIWVHKMHPPWTTSRIPREIQAFDATFTEPSFLQSRIPTLPPGVPDILRQSPQKLPPARTRMVVKQGNKPKIRCYECLALHGILTRTYERTSCCEPSIAVFFCILSWLFFQSERTRWAKSL